MASLRRIGLIDFGDLAVSDIVEVAQLADRLGYHRYWLAEHYEARSYRNSLIMTSVIAGMTSRMRIGPAGVLLRYYAAAAVANDALFLESVFGHRIDLGLAAGRLPAAVAAAYADGRGAVDEDARFPANARAVRSWLANEPARGGLPELWLLGSSDRRETGELAADLDASFSVTFFLTKTPPSPLPLRAYREARARRSVGARSSSVTLNMACVESSAERASFTDAHGSVGRPFVDTPARCRERIEEVCALYDVSEVTILPAGVGVERRTAFLRALAEEFRGTSVFQPPLALVEDERGALRTGTE